MMGTKGSTPSGDDTGAERQPILTGTSAVLFSDINERLMDEAYGKPVEPPTEQNAEGVAAEQETEASPDVELDDLLDTDAFGNKKVKVKVDGVESEVTLKELLKSYQLEKHLTQKGQQLGERERVLKEYESKFEATLKQASTPKDVPEDDPLAEVVDPYVKPLKQEIADLKKTVAELKGATQPLEYQSNLKKVDTYLKKSGYDDFMEYVPKIEEAILSLSVEEQAQADTPQAFINLYKDLKIRDLKKGAPTRANPDERPKPKVSKIAVESGSGGNSSVDDKTAKDKSLFDKAVESGKTEDWMALLSYRTK
jgi:hypothetical protein